MERIEPEFGIRVSLQGAGDRAIVTVCGDVDVATASVVRRRVLSLMSEGYSVTADLGQVSFMDVSGLQTLVDLIRISRRSGAGFAVTNPSRAVLRVAQLTRGANSVLWAYLGPPAGDSGN